MQLYKESEKLELKSSFGEWKEIIISLSAFANKKGGKIYPLLEDNSSFFITADFDSDIELRDHQEIALEKALEKDFRVIVSLPSSGRT